MMNIQVLKAELANLRSELRQKESEQPQNKIEIEKLVRKVLETKEKIERLTN